MALDLAAAISLPVGEEFYVSNPCPECGQAKLMVRVVLRGDRSPRTWEGNSARQKISVWHGFLVICAGCGWARDSNLRSS